MTARAILVSARATSHDADLAADLARNTYVAALNAAHADDHASCDACDAACDAARTADLAAHIARAAYLAARDAYLACGLDIHAVDTAQDANA